MATVLVVDDRAINRDLVRTILGYEGHQVIEADSGKEALGLIAANLPDLMISDVLMPGMDGYELARAVRANPETNALPIVFYTANYFEREARPIAAACGVQQIVAKDGDPRALVAAVTKALRSAPEASPPVDDQDFNRAHLKVLNAKLLDKIRELEEKERLNLLVEASAAVAGDIDGLHTTLERIVVAARALVAAQVAMLDLEDSSGWPLGSVADGTVPSAPVAGTPTVTLTIVSQQGLRGTLTITGKHSGADFNEADHALLARFVGAASSAIGNAHRYDDARRRNAWMRASSEATSNLLLGNPDEALAAVVNSAQMVANADVAWIETTPSFDGSALLSPTASQRASLASAVGAQLLREVAAGGEPVVLADATFGVDESSGLVADLAGIGPLLAVPLHAHEEMLGILILARRRKRPGFSPMDVEMASTFAGHAAVALEFARAQGDRDRLKLVEDRDRIARDLHDVVIQRLFAVGLGLEAMALRLPADQARQISAATGELDTTIHEIRAAIFSLRGSLAGATLSDRVTSVVRRAEQSLGFRPDLRIDGSVDEAVPEHLHLHLLATVNEALSNVARHAGASQVQVEVTVGNGELSAIIIDNGRGLPDDRHESGLKNLRKRSQLAGGTMTTNPGPKGKGLVITWVAPLAYAAAAAVG